LPGVPVTGGSVKRIFDEYIGRTNQDLLVEKEQAGDAVVFHCRGALSTLNSDSINALLKTIGAAPEKKIILDLSHVVHIDSVGLGSVAAAFKQASAAGTTFALVAKPPVRDVLELASLDKFLKIFDTVKIAAASLE
jgi:anti-anti-sigma factor